MSSSARRCPLRASRGWRRRHRRCRGRRRRLVGPQPAARVACQFVGEHPGIDDGLRTAVGPDGIHRMCGVAEQGHPAAYPSRGSGSRSTIGYSKTRFGAAGPALRRPASRDPSPPVADDLVGIGRRVPPASPGSGPGSTPSDLDNPIHQAVADRIGDELDDRPAPLTIAIVRPSRNGGIRRRRGTSARPTTAEDRPRDAAAARTTEWMPSAPTRSRRRHRPAAVWATTPSVRLGEAGQSRPRCGRRRVRVDRVTASTAACLQAAAVHRAAAGVR